MHFQCRIARPCRRCTPAPASRSRPLPDRSASRRRRASRSVRSKRSIRYRSRFPRRGHRWSAMPHGDPALGCRYRGFHDAARRLVGERGTLPLGPVDGVPGSWGSGAGFSTAHGPHPKLARSQAPKEEIRFRIVERGGVPGTKPERSQGLLGRGRGPDSRRFRASSQGRCCGRRWVCRARGGLRRSVLGSRPARSDRYQDQRACKGSGPARSRPSQGAHAAEYRQRRSQPMLRSLRDSLGALRS